MVIYLPLLVALVGVLMYALAPPTHPKTSEAGRIMFFVGLLAFLLEFHGPIGTIR